MAMMGSNATATSPACNPAVSWTNSDSGLLGGGQFPEWSQRCRPASMIWHDDTKDHHRQDRTDGAQWPPGRRQSLLEFLSLRTAARPMPNAMIKGTVMRPRGDAARVKSRRDKTLRHKKRECKDHKVKEHQQCRTAGCSAAYAPGLTTRKKPDPNVPPPRIRVMIGNRGQLFGQHLQVRFGHGDHECPASKQTTSGMHHPAGLC